LALAAVGFAAFTQVDERSGFGIFFAGSVIFSLGLAPVFTLAIDMIVAVAPPERAGAASGIAETAAEFGGALGIAVFGSIGIAVYRGLLPDLLPAGLPVETAAEALQTLPEALKVALELPSALGLELVRGAQEAFIQGVHLSAVIATIGSLGLAIFVVETLGRVRAGSEDEPHRELEEGAAAGTDDDRERDPAPVEP